VSDDHRTREVAIDGGAPLLVVDPVVRDQVGAGACRLVLLPHSCCLVALDRQRMHHFALEPRKNGRVCSARRAASFRHG
jgi:hypothetical protein